MSEKVSIDEVLEARAEFTDELFPKLFGEEEMGDPAREFTPSEIITVLAAYEGFLAKSGVIDIEKPTRPSSPLGRLGTSGYYRVIPGSNKPVNLENE